MRLKAPSLALLLALASFTLTAQEPPVTNARIETAPAAARSRCGPAGRSP